MPAPRRIAALTAAALALLVGACGEDDEGLLSAGQAANLEEYVDATQRALDADDCNEARTAAAEGADLASRQRGVDQELANNLVEGFTRAARRVETDCGEDEEETPTPTAEPTEAPTEAPTEIPTEEPTEVPTEEPTEVPTEEPTEVPTEDPGGAEVPGLGEEDNG